MLPVRRAGASSQTQELPPKRCLHLPGHVSKLEHLGLLASSFAEEASDSDANKQRSLLDTVSGITE